MSFFTDPQKYPHTPDALFLGIDERGEEVGVKTERHAITIAGSGSGKGACLLIPNAMLWPQNLLAIDVKGEIAEAASRIRQLRGQVVRVIDPFKAANIPDDLRGTFNPLAAIDRDSLTAREDIQVIADGLIARVNPNHEEWYQGAVDILAGLMAFTIATAPEDRRTFTSVRSLLLEPKEALYKTAQAMLDQTAFGGLAKAAGATIMTALETEKGMEKDFLGGARRATSWLDSEPIANVLSSSSFDLSILKTGAASVFLVLPPQYIATHSAFLRLFVGCAINSMMKGGATIDRRCLFLLDEFFSLGRMDSVSKGMGLMRGYGLSLWPFLQDLGQLESLYGDKLSQTFFGNSDATCFFGNTDPLTLDYISKNLGEITPDEAAKSLPRSLALFHNKGMVERVARTSYENSNTQYQHDMRKTGMARLPPDAVAALVAKGNDDVVAQKMVVFAKAGDKLLVTPLPYFDNDLPQEQSVRGRIVNAKGINETQKMLDFQASWKILIAVPLLWVVVETIRTRGEIPSQGSILTAFVIGLLIMVTTRLFKPLFSRIDRHYKRTINRWTNSRR